MGYDVDIRSTNITIESDMIGRRKILIPIDKETFDSNPKIYIKKYLAEIEEQHIKNIAEMQYLQNYKKGIQDILNKIRANGTSKVNNISITNYAKEIIDFKKGFYVGKPITYVSTNSDDNDNITYLNKYLRDTKKSSKDLKKYDNILTTGIGYTFIAPKKKSYNSEKESPFDYIILDNENVCMVYSDDMIRSPLFSVYFSKRNIANKDGIVENYYTYTCYFNFQSVEFYKDGIDYKVYKEKSQEPIEQPITEYELNPDRMGAFEAVLSGLNSCNVVRSNQLDDIEEFVNAWIVFLNQNPEYIKNHQNEIREAKMLALKTNNPNTPADVKMLTSQLSHGEINDLYKNMKQDIFNIVGVPVGTSSTGQGVSGTSQQYGSGWENAQAIATVDTSYMEDFERQDLEKILYICKKGVNPKLNNLDSSDIEIKYIINKSNDIMNKAQSFKYLVDLGVPYASAFEITQLHDDAHSLGQLSEENYKIREKFKNDLEIEKEKAIYANQKEIDSKYVTIINEEDNSLNKENDI